jgi:hypothetical protein
VTITTVLQLGEVVDLMIAKGVQRLRLGGMDIQIGPAPMVRPGPETEEPARREEPITRAEDDPVTFGGRLPGLERYPEE